LKKKNIIREYVLAGKVGLNIEITILRAEVCGNVMLAINIFGLVGFDNCTF